MPNKNCTLSHVFFLFCPHQKLSGDAFEAFEGAADPNNPNAAPKMTVVHTVSVHDDPNAVQTTLSPDLKRSASQGSLHSGENDNLLSTARQESKNRLSFKMVRQTMKVSTYTQTFSNPV